MQSVTCLFPRKQPQTPRRLSKVSGGEGTELRTVCAHRWKSPCWILANRKFVGAEWMLKKNTNKKKTRCYKKHQLRLLNRHLRDHRHLSWLSAERVRRFGALNKEPFLRWGSTFLCLLFCARNSSELVCRCCHPVNQRNTPQTAAYALSDIGHMESIHYDCG